MLPGAVVGKTPPQGTEHIKLLARLQAGQGPRPAADDLEEDLDQAPLGNLVDGKGPAQERVEPLGDPHHDKLARFRTGGDICHVHREPVNVV